MARRGENIRKRKDGRYEARYKSGFDKNGIPIYKSVYGKTYTEAKNNRLSIISGNKQKTNKSYLLVRDIAIEWLEMKKLEVKKSTFAKYYDTVYNHIIRSIGGIKLCNINQNTINDLILNKYNNGLGTKSIKGIVNVLKQVLSFSEKQYNCNIGNLDYIIPKEEFKEVQTLSQNEQTRLIHYLLSNLDRKNLGLLICLNTGLRIGELCALKHENINFTKSCICIRKTMQRIKNMNPKSKKKTIITIDEPKSKTSMRDIPIKSFLLDKIDYFKGNENDFILTGSKVEYIEPRTMENHLKRILNTLNIKAVKFHALRHTFATNMIESGCDPKTLSELLGHSDVQLTLKTYVHSSYELKKKSIEKLPEYCA